MTITNSQSGTNAHEVFNGIYRINTPVVFEGGSGFSFNQYLIADDEPLLFHTGPRKMFPLVREAVTSVLWQRNCCVHLLMSYLHNSLATWHEDVAQRGGPAADRCRS